METTIQTKEIIVEVTAITNPNIEQAMEAVKTTTDTHGKLFGVSFIKLLHQIVLF